jgi:hypothetical protein
MITPMPAYAAMSVAGMTRTARHTRGTSASITATSIIRHHTSGSAGSEISRPKIAVKPQRTTQM